MAKRRSNPSGKGGIRCNQCHMTLGRLDRLTDRKGDGLGLLPLANCLDQDQTFGGLPSTGQEPRRLGMPLIRDRRRPQSLVEQCAPGIGRRVDPGPHIPRRRAQAPEHATKWPVGVVRTGFSPDLRLDTRIEARQHDRALWQSRHRGKQLGSGRNRPGRACSNDRMIRRVLLPGCNQVFDDGALALTGVGCARRLLFTDLRPAGPDQIDEPECLQPVTGGLGCEPGSCDGVLQVGNGSPLVVELVHQEGQLVSQSQGRGCGSFGLPCLARTRQEGLDQPRELQPSPTGR